MSSCPCGKNPNQSDGRGRGSPSSRGVDSSMDGKNKGQPIDCHPCGKKRRANDGLGDGRGGTGTGMGNTGRGFSGPWQDFSGSGEGKGIENAHAQQCPCPSQQYRGGTSQEYSHRSDIYGGSSQGRSGPRQMFIDAPDNKSVEGSKMGGSGRMTCPGSIGGSCNKSSCLGCKKGLSDGRSYMTGDRQSRGTSDYRSGASDYRSGPSDYRSGPSDYRSGPSDYRSGDQQSGAKGDGSDLNDRNTGNPLNFEMNEASWGLCKAAAIFLCGVYLTTRMQNVANLIG